MSGDNRNSPDALGDFVDGFVVGVKAYAEVLLRKGRGISVCRDGKSCLLFLLSSGGTEPSGFPKIRFPASFDVGLLIGASSSSRIGE